MCTIMQEPSPVQKLCDSIEAFVIGVPRCSSYCQYREIAFIRRLSQELLPNDQCPNWVPSLVAGLFAPAQGIRVCRHKAVVYDIPATADGRYPAVSALVAADDQGICVVVGKLEQNHEDFFAKYDLESCEALRTAIVYGWDQVPRGQRCGEQHREQCGEQCGEQQEQFVYTGRRFDVVSAQFSMQRFTPRQTP